MEFLNRVIIRFNTLRGFLTSLNTRQRILSIIFSLFVLHLCMLSFGLTLIFTCGTGLGVWCALQIAKTPAVFQWENAIPFLPHIAKQRALYRIYHEKGNDEGNTMSISQSPSHQTILQAEMSEYVRLLMRDFVMEWYRILSDDDQFSHNVFCHFKDMIKNINARFVRVDQKAFLCTLLHELRAHVDIFRRLQMSRTRLASKTSKLGRSAKKHSVVSIYETFAILHPALQSEGVEKEHLSQLTNTLILALLPTDVVHCNSLIFLLQDILINNVFQPLVQLISDPDFLNEAFILLLMDEPLVQEQKHSAADERPGSLSKEKPGISSSICETGQDRSKDEKDSTVATPSESIHQDTYEKDKFDHGLDVETVKENSKYKSEDNIIPLNSKNSAIKQDSESISTSQIHIGDEPVKTLDLNKTNIVKKLVPSPFEVIEPAQQFTFPMPMTMLEASTPISIPVADTTSKGNDKDEIIEKLDSPESPGLTLTVKSHRRSASTGSSMVAIQTSVTSQSAGTANDSVISCMANDDYIQASQLEGMRSCFSANCLTELYDVAPLSQETLMSVNVGRRESTSSLASSSDLSSSLPPSSVMSSEEQQDTDGHQRNSEDNNELHPSTSQSSSPSHKNALLRSVTAPDLIEHPPETTLHPPPGGDIPLEWSTWRVNNLFIPTTSWIGDPKGMRPFVYFIIKYDLLKKPTLSDDSNTAYSSKQEMEVKRHYREFVNLHARVSSNRHLRRSMKGIVNFPKQSMLPLTRPTPAMEEQKRVSLETYLKQLLSRPVIHNSREMAEFLAIDGDGHIEFVKKASSRALRIDKLLKHQVSGFVGTLKTILPERASILKTAMQPNPTIIPPPSPAAQPSHVEQSHDTNRPMAEETSQGVTRSQPVGGDDQWDFGGVGDSRIRLFGLDEMKESHMQRVMKFLVSQKHEQFIQDMPPSSPLLMDYDKVFLGPRSEGDGTDNPSEPHREGTGTKTQPREGSKDNVEVYKAIFGVMSEALLNKGSFILDEDLQRSLTILIGDLIDKWLFQEIGLLFTEAQWGYYLSLLRELLWPDGVWSPTDRESKTPEELAQTKADALHELTHNAAAAVLSVILGEENLHDGISLVLDSLQDQALNKHLLFTFLDHAMDQLIPEIHDPKFQNTLTSMP